MASTAFPVIPSERTVLWQDGMDSTVKVPTPAGMCQARTSGLTVLMSIGDLLDHLGRLDGLDLRQ